MTIQSTPLLYLCLICTILVSCDGNAGDAFTLINKVQTMCEFDSMTTSSKLSDYYNSLDEATPKQDRTKHEYFAEHIGFGWEHSASARGQIPAEVAQLQKKGGWLNSESIPLAYESVGNKWVYFYGDVTMRPIATTFLLPSHAKDMREGGKEWANSKCTSQEKHRTPVPKTEDEQNTAHVAHAGKARTCNFPGFGANGKITYDWKHSPYDEYDQYLFGPEGLWPVSSATDSPSAASAHPDIFVIQAGHSTCLHSNQPDRTKTELHLDDATVQQHAQDIPKLFQAIRSAVTRHPEKPTTVIVSTAPRVMTGNNKADRCVYRMNRIIAREAHRNKFAVLEREEMEHRMMFKSEASEDLKEVVDIAEPPTNHIIATSLLSLITCLQKNGTQPTVVNRN